MNHGLHLDNISHRYDSEWAIRDLDLSVQAGEIVCLLGPSGCGKTTALRLAAGLEILQFGAVRIGDRVVADGSGKQQEPPEKRSVGLMFQDYALFPHLTVAENVAFGMPRGAGQQGIRQALRDVHLEHLADRYPHTLSGGQQQRVALLRALAPKPRVMLLDEPFSGLDQHLRQQVRQETLSMLRDTDVATLMVTHDPEEAMYLADRIVVLNHAEIAQDASPIDIYQHPSDPFVARLFGPINEFRSVVQDAVVDTPLGIFSAPGLEDSSDALVLVRASDVTVVDSSTAQPHTITGRVVSARPLGPSSEILVRVEGREGQMDVLCHISGLDMPSADSEIVLAVRNDCELVFPAS
jgi:iron(III) transport system ATP-binding protein